MAEAALKYDEFEDFDDIEPVQIPAGGIATFLTAREGMFADDDDDELPSGGIASVKQVADKLAEYGRHEDEFMVHAAEGETVIPMEVFRKNPILKENIFRQMRDMGLEPERYIVGNELNSINPVTGQPEFFLKKLFKKLGKFLKKAVSVVLPIVGAIFLGPLGASLGSGIATLIQGGNLKDAFKAAALSGLTAGAMNAIGGGISAVKEGGTFLAGAKEGALGSGGFTRTFAEATAAGKAAGVQAAAGEALSAAGGPAIDAGAAFGTGPDAVTAASKLEALSTKLTADGMSGDAIQQIVNEGLNQGMSLDQILASQNVQFQPAKFLTFDGLPADGTAAEQIAARETFLQSGAPRPGGAGTALQKVDGVDLVTPSRTVGPKTVVAKVDTGTQIETTFADGTTTVEPKILDTADITGRDLTPRELARRQAQQNQMSLDPLRTTTDTAQGTAGTAGTVGGAEVSGAESATGVGPEVDVSKTLTEISVPGMRESAQKIVGIGGEFRPIEGMKELFAPQLSVRRQALEIAQGMATRGEIPQALVRSTARELAAAELTGIGGFVRKFGPAIGGVMAIDALQGQENPESLDMSQEGINQALTLLEENPERYRSFQNLQIRGGGQFSPFEIQPIYSEPLGTTTYQSTAKVAGGGGMDVNDFPPRIGRISGPGTETSDDIPAMLSDGEFVMTAEAVRGAGNGSREAGMRNMYQMMNQFEAMA